MKSTIQLYDKTLVIPHISHFHVRTYVPESLDDTSDRPSCTLEVFMTSGMCGYLKRNLTVSQHDQLVSKIEAAIDEYYSRQPPALLPGTAVGVLA